MRVAGIIAEYNPFHGGHRYHIGQTREAAGADAVVVVMSGDFVQRGEPACFDKYLRTKCALLGGADLVIEMPAAYATSTAEYFADAGVDLLDGLGVVDLLSFGSEYASAEELQEVCDLLLSEPEEYRAFLGEGLASGMNYPSARQDAVARCLGEKKARLLAEPNHILGIEYCKALKRRGSRIQPWALTREGSGYHEEEMTDGFPSATAIRRTLQTWKNVSDQKTAEVFRQMLMEAMGPGSEACLAACQADETMDWNQLMPYLKYALIFYDGSQDLGIPKDMAARIMGAEPVPDTLEEMVAKLHCRSFTDTAFKRALLHILLHIRERSLAGRHIPYARVLGFSGKGQELLGEIRKNSRIEVLQKSSEIKALARKDPFAKEMLLEDLRSEQLYESVVAAAAGRKSIHPYIRKQVRER